MISLPIDDFLKSISESLEQHPNLVISAAPGAGKTTRVPPELLKMTNKKILVLEPRRIAASSAAQRIADEQGWALGKEVGYQVRFENKTSSQTRLIFLTEALLARHLMQDPELSDIGLIVLDEFHERSQHVDLAIGFLKELQDLARPDLKIVVMSATLNAQSLSDFLKNCPVIDVPGKMFPLTIQHQKTAQLLKTSPDFIDRVSNQIKSALLSQDSGKHILVFLPGLGEIERVSERLLQTSLPANFKVLKLHGSLSLEEQKRVLEPSQETKIILSTNVAESSVTIDGVNCVIDSGLVRQQRLNQKTGFPRLDLVRISKASATQRAGRAARQGPGKVFRLWSVPDELSMLDFEQAEIFRVNLIDSLLLLANWGVSDFLSFSWFETPLPESIASAQKELQLLGCIDSKNKLTPLGSAALHWPLPVRLAILMEHGRTLNLLPLAARISAILLEKDFVKGPISSVYECDLMARIDLIENRQAPQASQRAYQKSVENLMRGTNASWTWHNNATSHSQIVDLLSLSFPDRLARRRQKNQPSALLITGRGIALDSESCVQQSEFFLALELMDGVSASDTRCRKATSVKRDWLEKKFAQNIEVKQSVDYSQSEKKVQKSVRKMLILAEVGQLPLEDGQLRPATNDEAAEFLPQIAVQSFSEILEKNAPFRLWWNRYLAYCSIESKPPFDQHQEQEIFSEACYGETSLKALFEKDLIYFFEKSLNPIDLQKMNREYPSEMVIPTGRSVPLSYTKDGVQIEVRIQEIFGLRQAPLIAGGKVPITLILLGPNYRPVQVTSDLLSFWKNGYIEVKKELKARYPKHSWPDDPLTAPPQARPSRKK